MARRILGALLATMALGQVSDLVGFVDIVETHELGGRSVAWLVSTLLIAGEATAAIGLLGGSSTARRLGAMVAVVVAAEWSVLAGQAFSRGLVLDNCGCFGVHLGQPLRWWILVEDAEFVALAWWVRRTLRTAAGPVAIEQVAAG